MDPSAAYSLAHVYTIADAQDRHRGEERRHAHHRALLGGRPLGPSLPARLSATIRKLTQRDHSLTDYPCRLPDGKIGRVAVVLQNGDWTLVCQVA